MIYSWLIIKKVDYEDRFEKTDFGGNEETQDQHPGGQPGDRVQPADSVRFFRRAKGARRRVPAESAQPARGENCVFGKEGQLATDDTEVTENIRKEISLWKK